MEMNSSVTSIIMAAGRGSRMKMYDGNKTLLPLIPGSSSFEGQKPILIHILSTLPPGPQAVIVNYKSEDVKNASQAFDLTYCHQPELNGTGGALLAARDFLDSQSSENVLITMGDVPFVHADTYIKLVNKLDEHHLVVLGFQPKDKKQYGVLEIRENRVEKITEAKYWMKYPKEKQASLTICNSGIYAARLETLRRFLPVLASRPQIVRKERRGVMTDIREYFITDIVEYMNADGLSVGCSLTENEAETMGVDDPAALEKARKYYREIMGDA